MTGMVIKDFYVMSAMAKTYLVMMAVFLILNVLGIYDTSIFGVMFIVILMVMPTSAFAYDEQAGWDKYAVSTPAGRRGVVRGKYLLVLLLWGAALAIMLAVGAFQAFVRGPGVTDMLLSTGFMLCMALVMQAILLPILFKFGSQKSRIAMMVVAGATGGGGVALSGILGEAGMERAIGLLAVLLPVIALGGMVISYSTSLSIYQKKEL